MHVEETTKYSLLQNAAIGAELELEAVQPIFAQPLQAFKADDGVERFIEDEMGALTFEDIKDFVIESDINGGRIKISTELVLYYKLKGKETWNNVKFDNEMNLNVRKATCCFHSDLNVLSLKASIRKRSGGGSEFYVQTRTELHPRKVIYNKIVTYKYKIVERSLSYYLRTLCCPPHAFYKVCCIDNGERELDLMLGNF